jgi:hypothetical protein
VKKNAHYLLSLIKYKKQGQDFVKLADKGQIKAICEVVANIIYGNITIDEKSKRKLQVGRKVFELIATKGQSETFCRKIITRHVHKILILLEAGKAFIESL